MARLARRCGALFAVLLMLLVALASKHALVSAASNSTTTAIPTTTTTTTTPIVCQSASEQACARKGRMPCRNDPNVCGPCLRDHPYAARGGDPTQDGNSNCTSRIDRPKIATEQGHIVADALSGDIFLRFLNGQELSVSSLAALHTNMQNELSLALDDLRGEFATKLAELEAQYKAEIQSLRIALQRSNSSLESEIETLDSSKADVADVHRVESSIESVQSSVISINSALNNKVDLEGQASLETALRSDISIVASDGQDTANALEGLLETAARVTDVEASFEELRMDISEVSTAERNTASLFDGLIVKISAQSSGLCSGSARRLWINDEPYTWTSSWSRGINTVEFHPTTMQVVREQNFDTCCGSSPATEADRLTQYINGLAEGVPVVFVIHDEGISAADDELKSAIESMGSRYIRTITYRESWAMIGIKGAFPGTVPEAYGSKVDDPGCTRDPPVQDETAIISQLFFAGKLAPFNQELARRSYANGLERFRKRSSSTWDAMVWGGYISGDVAGIAELGTIPRTSNYQRYIDIKVYGSHRGYNVNSYFEFKHYVIMCGDKCSAALIDAAGRGTVSLYDTIHHDSNTYAGNGDIDIPPEGFVIALRFTPVIGANFDYTVVVNYYDFDEFHPSFVPSDHRCFDMRGNAGYSYPYVSFKCRDV
ncbi:hypothetical protein PTSG_01220 [Salpingoeca rosetta]|uniref:ILEI/PANDER domain-containing protein n=1 Tax=Salpingoeca rosetta (strain ATCC 50818 / BSB-021) TaxID=946362 RepID=F2U158_SALR5|nr:uncharacterized protein PTSG_01220 [Salpingoeca rosetta]EGD80632.1 hypothetical protein PTSG_01220 [Salpingoeca rosetta]|eukprot:XP_004997193.1 hypothetical protein PTSG_01220 [Salpingoeca rosetta]